MNLSICSSWAYAVRNYSSSSSLFVAGAASTEDQKRNSVSNMPVIPSTPTAQGLDSGGDLVGGKVANTVELGAGGTFTTYSSVDACGRCAFKCGSIDEVASRWVYTLSSIINGDGERGGSDERLLKLNPSRQIPARVRTRKSNASISSSSYLIQARPTQHHGVYAILLLFNR
jgi:hypothetical protein